MDLVHTKYSLSVTLETHT